MITKGVDVIVIASIDGEALTDVIEKAKGQDIPIVAYDRLIMNTDGVDYYATFDNYQVGVYQGAYIVETLALEIMKDLFILNFLVVHQMIIMLDFFMKEQCLFSNHI